MNPAPKPRAGWARRAWRWSYSWPVGGQVAFAAVVLICALALLAAALGSSQNDAQPAAESPVTTSAPPTTSTVPTTTTTAVPTTTTPPPTITTVPPPAPPTETGTQPGLPVLTIAAANPAGYNRDLFRHWIDADHDCQNTRAEVLIEESAVPVTLSANGCTVVSGQWTSPWSGGTTTTAGSFDVDHTVPLANAWRSGAYAWDAAQRQAFANDLSDPEHLIALPAGENRSKSDAGPEEWRPLNPATWCRYAIAWATIKVRWALTAVQAEWDALEEMAATC